MMSQSPSVLSSTLPPACESRDFEEGGVKPWIEELNLVVRGRGAQQEGVHLSYRDRLGLTGGHHAVACHEAVYHYSLESGMHFIHKQETHKHVK